MASTADVPKVAGDIGGLEPLLNRCLINGEWRTPASDDRFDVVNPSTGLSIASVAAASSTDIDLAVEAARAAFPGWRATDPSERARMLLDFASAVEAHGAELAAIEALNIGRVPSTVIEYDLPLGVRALRFFAEEAISLAEPVRFEGVPDYTSSIQREPVGVVGQLGPWNFPFLITLAMLSPTLAAGNTIVFKPAPQTPLGAMFLADLAREIFPPGVLNLITGEGAASGSHIASHPDVDIVDVVGGIETGKRVAQAAAGTLKGTHLELGGNAPVVVFNDADLDEAVSAIRFNAFYNAGQDCGASTRVLVEADVFDEFVSRLAAAVASIKVGYPLEESEAEMGPVISESHRAKVLGFIDRARASGAKVVTGGAAVERPGFFVEPTVITDADQADEIIQDEVFGPVATIQRFSGTAEALELANGVKQGIASSVFSRDIEKAEQIAEQLLFGTVWINTHGVMQAETPWSGFRQSGGGVQLSRYALEEYTQVKHIMSPRGKGSQAQK